MKKESLEKATTLQENPIDSQFKNSKASDDGDKISNDKLDNDEDVPASRDDTENQIKITGINLLFFKKISGIICFTSILNTISTCI